MGGLNLAGFHRVERLVWGISLRRRNRVAANASTHLDILLLHSPRWQKAAVSATQSFARPIALRGAPTAASVKPHCSDAAAKERSQSAASFTSDVRKPPIASDAAGMSEDGSGLISLKNSHLIERQVADSIPALGRRFDDVGTEAGGAGIAVL